MNINQFDQPVGEALPHWQPVARPHSVPLQGQHCLLLPLSVDHAELLLQAFMLAPDDRDWTWLSAERPASLVQMQRWIADKVADKALVPFTVCTPNQQPCGVVCFASIEPEHGTLEIGHVTWSPQVLFLHRPMTRSKPQRIPQKRSSALLKRRLTLPAMLLVMRCCLRIPTA